ncbi:MAG: globin family protein [Pseudomonadota bacterium]
MALTAEQIGVVRTTWARAVPVAGLAASLFYGELFKRAPETRALFTSDMAAQGKKLMATLAFVVDHLDRPEVLLPAAENLAKRHLDYGVTADQYAPVGDALLWTFQELLGTDFGAPERDAWSTAYGALSNHMIECAY